MQRVRRYRFVSIVLCVALGSLIAITACSNYGEGERCDVLNNNDDCDDGLQCTPKAQLGLGSNSDRCCPVDRTTATEVICKLAQSPIGGDSAPPAETGPVNETGTDSATETSTPAEAGTEAGVDAADAAEGG